MTLWEVISLPENGGRRRWKKAEKGVGRGEMEVDDVGKIGEDRLEKEEEK